MSDDIAITRMFATPVASIVVPDAADLNAALREAIFAREAVDRGVTISNNGGWQSDDGFLDWSGPAGAELIAFTRRFANTLSAIEHPEHGLLEADVDWLLNAWANVNRAGHGNDQHVHPGSFWSAVYWVDCGGGEGAAPAGGELEFHDPRGAWPAMLSPYLRMRIEGCLSAGGTHRIRPRTGMLVMFPSWLAHGVTRYTGDRPRVSVAINLAPRNA